MTDAEPNRSTGPLGRCWARALPAAGAPSRRRLLGLVLIAAGALLLAHPWWSGIEESNAQRVLAGEVTRPAPVTAAAAARAPAAPLLVPLGGWRPPGPVPQVYATLTIPALGLTTFVVRGATLTDYYDLLAWGPAHLSGTPEPGGVGNVVIFGHVDEFGAPFRHLDRLRPGDAITLAQGASHYRYTVRALATVPADDLAVLAAPAGARDLTLFTCGGPANSQRVVVQATLAGADLAPPPGGPR